MIDRLLFSSVLMVSFGTAAVWGQCCGDAVITTASVPVTTGYPVTVNYPAAQTSVVGAGIPVTTYKVEYATEYREEEVFSEQLVWDTEIRERKITEYKQVPETSVHRETYRVMKPVWVTEYRDTSYDVIKQVPETSVREERHIVNRPVTETLQRDVVQTVLRPVQQTVLQQRQYTVNRPVTTYQTQVVDRGGYVNYTAVEPGKTYNRITWQSGGTYVDPITGVTRSRWPGFYWTPMHSDPKLTQQSVYQPNYVAEQRPVTSLIPETVVEQIPVTQTTYQQEQITRTEPYQVSRIVQEQVVQKVPVTTYRQVVERVPQTTPVQVLKMEAQEVTKDIPTTTYKTVAFERTEPYEVKVPRIVKVSQKVMRPYTVERKIPLDSQGNPIIVPEITKIPTPAAISTDDPASQKPAIPSEDKIEESQQNSKINLGTQ
ncbi:MAG: hypothetical protein LBQ54_11335 [Planctomycetaceae bacterium]|jgi:hypothetical protein|nr:hypothetical protein [Planctomycetaceae bacterium]